MGAWIETIENERPVDKKRVAPRVGAWIETEYHFLMTGSWRVAPRVGAWIETGRMVSQLSEPESRPAWARGLKLMRNNIR